MQPNSTTQKTYCNTAAQALGLDPVGYAGNFEDAVLIETPLPWKRDLYKAAGALPQEAIDLLDLWLQRYRETGVYGHRPLLIAPDDAYTRPGHRRVIYYARPDGPFARFAKQEYLVPHDDTGPLLWALFEARETLPRFEEYRVPNDQSGRDILVCTHGAIDVVCAKFGYPLYQRLRNEFAGSDGEEAVRVWRVSHFGGHVFAPTLVDMPTGHYWAYVGEEQAAQIVQRTGDVALLHGHYRGWAGLPRGFAQAAARELWQREGWSWFDYPKSGEIVDQDPAEEPQWADVELRYTTPRDGERAWQARVEVARTVETIPSTDAEKTYKYPQYTVTDPTELESLHLAVSAGGIR